MGNSDTETTIVLMFEGEIPLSSQLCQKLEYRGKSDSSEEMTKMMSGAMFVYPLTELEEAEGRRDWGI
jgi:hypothetical protein